MHSNQTYVVLQQHNSIVTPRLFRKAVLRNNDIIIVVIVIIIITIIIIIIIILWVQKSVCMGLADSWNMLSSM